MTRAALACALALAGCLSARHSEAQVLERPERAIRGLFGGQPPIDPTRTRQELTLTLDSLGGYDNSLMPFEASGIDAFTPREPGYTGFAAAALRYWRGREAKTFSARGRGYVNSFRGLGLTPSHGGDLEASAGTPLGRKFHLNVVAASRIEPFYAPGALTPLQVGDVMPAANPADGYYTRRSTEHDASLFLVNRLSNRNTILGGYRYRIRDFADDIGDARHHQASLEYIRATRRHGSLRTAYRRLDSTFFEYGVALPNTQDILEVGLQHEKRLDRTRRFWFGFGGGATHVTSVEPSSRKPVDYVMPSGYGSARLDVGRTWSMSGDYRRALTVIEGLTLQQFVTDGAFARVGGFLGRRSELVFSGAYAEGAAAQGLQGTFSSNTVAGQFRFLLTGRWSALISHTFYSYALHNVPDLPVGFSDQLDRHAFRVGMTLDLPLYGAYSGRRPTPAP